MRSYYEIIVGARNSPLSKKQVEEVYTEFKKYHTDIIFNSIYIETIGDREKSISLRTLDKTDFFTREIDLMLLRKECRIAIHSAKDLPDPLTKGIKLVALTRGLDPSDVLVLREKTLPHNGIVATSSYRREESVRQLYPQASFVDIRGTIQERLSQLDSGEVDGVVVAEAALIRLGLTHLNRIRLPGKTAPLQGRLAIVAREEDDKMFKLLNCLNET